jgi:hypothetical protein
MPDNDAIIIANSASYGGTGHNIPSNVVRAIATEFADNLGNLGEDSFRAVSTVVNETAQHARELIRESIKKAGSADLLLIFYFGHAVKSLDDELYFLFKDSDYLEFPGMLDFEEIAGWLRRYHVPNVLVALDCCYAGIVRNEPPRLNDYEGGYYLMSSVTHRGKAEVDYGDRRPLGVFSRYLLQAFTTPEARAPSTRDVTPQSLFNFADRATRGSSHQTPDYADGGLANQVLFRQASALRVPAAIRASVPKKSTYRRLFVLGSYLAQGPFPSEESLFRFLSREKPAEFLTPHRTEAGVVEYGFIGFGAFSHYLKLGQELGMIQAATIALTPTGKAMVRNDGSQYNQLLLDSVVRAWARYQIEIADLEDAIASRMQGNGIPSLDGVFVDMYLSKKLSMSKAVFRTLLDLTGHIGVIKSTRQPTYFLPPSYE